MMSFKQFIEESKSMEGKIIGDWKITFYDELKFDEKGNPYGGLVRIVSEIDFETLIVSHNLNMKNPLWFVRHRGHKYENRNPIDLIKQLRSK